MKKILVPLDFSENSQKALVVAAEIALKSGASLMLLHVNVAALYSTPISEYVAVSNYVVKDPEYDESAATALGGLKSALFSNPEYAKLDISIHVEDGFLYSVVNDVAKNDGVDLVVMGTKGSSGLTAFLLGSNTEKVMRTSPCPVLAIPERAGAFNPKIVLLPTTLKNDQKGVFHYLGQWEKMYDFILKVLYVNNPASLPTDGSAEAQKNRFVEAAGLKKTDVILTTGSFSEGNAILLAADQCNADMIVMGAHQRHGLSQWLFGSITADTVNHSQIPVLAIPIGAWPLDN